MFVFVGCFIYNLFLFLLIMLGGHEVVFNMSDEEEEEYVFRRPRLVRRRKNHFEMDDVEFRKRYRLSKQVTLSVLEQIEDRLEFPTDR